MAKEGERNPKRLAEGVIALYRKPTLSRGRDAADNHPRCANIPFLLLPKGFFGVNRRPWENAPALGRHRGRPTGRAERRLAQLSWLLGQVFREPIGELVDLSGSRSLARRASPSRYARCRSARLRRTFSWAFRCKAAFQHIHQANNVLRRRPARRPLLGQL